MSLPAPRLFSPENDQHLFVEFAQIHADCITHDHQLASFLPPLNHNRMVDYWTRHAERVEQGEVAIIVQFAADEDGKAEVEVAGYVCLLMPETETGPFRGIVEKLMVSPRHRRKGVARRVVEKLEAVAREKRRELLVLRIL